jgi:hypothetical protein
LSDVKRPWIVGSRRARLTAVAAAALLVGGFAVTPVAFGDAAPGRYPAAEIHRPSPIPDLSVHDSTVYAVSVSGGKMYDVDGSVWTGNGADIMSKAEDKQLYQLIDVTADSIRYEARYANGELHDGVVIRKNAAGERTVNELRTPENTTGEQVAVDRTTVTRKDRLTISAYGYDPGEQVAVYLRDTRGGTGRKKVLVAHRRADELGRLTYSFRLPPLVTRKGTYVVYLESPNQRITSPVITVTR